MKNLYNIKDIVFNVVDKIDTEKICSFEEINNIIFDKIENSLKKYINLVKVDKNKVLIGINNSVIFSEIIGFRKKELEKKIIFILKEKGIKEVKFKLI